MADDVKDTIEKNAQGPRQAKGDVGEVQQHSLKDQVDADRYLASREARSTMALQFSGSPASASTFAAASRPLIKLAGVASAPHRGQHLLRCREVLRGMRRRAMHLDPPIARVLEQLDAMA